MDSTEQIEKYRHDLAFLQLMADQTVKDFQRFGYEVKFNENLPVCFENFRLQLAADLKNWCSNDSKRLASLMYAIDVPEHKLPARSGCADPSKMAEVILQRELIKVVIRKLYSG